MRASAVALGAALLCGCFQPPDPRLSQQTEDRIARCGAGIELGDGVTLGVVSDVERGQGISVERANAIRATIVAKAGVANVAPIYAQYVACIRSEGEVEQLVTDLRSRREKLKAALEKDGVKPPELPNILTLADVELADTQAYHFIAARNDRRDLLVAMYRASQDYGFDLINDGPFLELRKPAGKALRLPNMKFVRWCSRYAGRDPLCESVPATAPKPVNLNWLLGG